MSDEPRGLRLADGLDVQALDALNLGAPAEPRPEPTANEHARRLLRKAEERYMEGAIEPAQALATMAGGWATLALTEPLQQPEQPACLHPSDQRKLVPVVDGTRVRKEWRCQACGEVIPEPAP